MAGSTMEPHINERIIERREQEQLSIDINKFVAAEQYPRVTGQSRARLLVGGHAGFLHRLAAFAQEAFALTDFVLRRRAAEHKLIGIDRKSTRLNSSHSQISYAVFCLK